MPIDNIRKTRLKKLENIRKAGFNPYPAKAKRTHTVEEALASFDGLSRAQTKISLVGRLRSIREHGGSTFFDFNDETGSVQGYLKLDKVGEKNYRFFLDNFDIGDFVEVSGVLFTTKKGEKTIEVSFFNILAKALLPLPEKWHGLKDVEERFRKRYLDLIMNPEAKDKLSMRSRIIASLRSVLDKEGFLEVETPVLQPIPGGALAKPFKTHLNALKLDLYLRVAPELYLKRLLVGGFEKVFELGRAFRNEGMDFSHNPDFTILEFYWAYHDKEDLMKFTEKMMIELLNETKKSLEITYQGQKINFKAPWKVIKFKDLIKNVKEKGTADEKFKIACRKIVGPTFVVDHPVEMSSLNKAKEGSPKEADRFQVVVGGIELINAYSELNDPIEQEKRFKSKLSQDRMDHDFIEALEYGMPPAAGFGMGIDRLVALLTDSHSLREVILFPIMRPK
ncbi:MAG: amino acid--tRNA ligase-related protein [Candidatus Nealsonbacteria bacterium]